jgi:uncharacterized membrane protein
MPPSPTDVEALAGLRSVAQAQRPDRSVNGVTDRSLRWLYTIGGGVGLTASFTLFIEKLAMIADPAYVPSCSINPVLSCGSIMKTDQSAAFGFPNPVLGIAGFTIVVTIGFAMFGGATFRRWFWKGMLLGTAAGVVFVHWLIFQSLYRIGALCPYCMVVWIITIPTFWYTAVRAVRVHTDHSAAPSSRVASFALDNHGAILTAWYLVIAALVLQRFWDYWETLLW